MTRLEDLFEDFPDEGSKNHQTPGATGGEVGPSLIIFADEVEKGMTLISPDRCGGRGNCSLSATTHASGQYHVFQVLRARNVEVTPSVNATVIIYLDEDSEPQAIGPMIGFGPMRVRLESMNFDLADITDPGHKEH
jgi:hypothetical protein